MEELANLLRCDLCSYTVHDPIQLTICGCLFCKTCMLYYQEKFWEFKVECSNSSLRLVCPKNSCRKELSLSDKKRYYENRILSEFIRVMQKRKLSESY